MAVSEAADAKTSKSVFGPNYERLQRVKARYDPDDTFGKWFPIQPAPAAV
jgi:FAD/FMN-containing dehydrogenase